MDRACIAVLSPNIGFAPALPREAAGQSGVSSYEKARIYRRDSLGSSPAASSRKKRARSPFFAFSIFFRTSRCFFLLEASETQLYEIKLHFSDLPSLIHVF
jgi:hypothetical protein